MPLLKSLAMSLIFYHIFRSVFILYTIELASYGLEIFEILEAPGFSAFSIADPSE